MQKIREILINEYIGAIAIGLLMVQAAGSAINVIVQIVGFYLEKNTRSPSVFSGAQRGFPLLPVAGLVINLILYLLIIYLLLYWLYLRQAPPEPPVDRTKEGSEQQA